MMTDPIADFLIRIKNGYMAHKKQVIVPYSRIKDALAKLLVKEGYLGEVKIRSQKGIKELALDLMYENKIPKLTEVVRMSKSGRKMYVKKDKIPKVLGGLGILVLSTPQGLMTDKQARKKQVGGEIICKIW